MPIGKRIDTETLTGDVPESPAEYTHKVSRVPVFQTQSPQYTFQDIILNHSTYDAIQDALALYEKKDLLFVEWGLEATHKMQNRAGINFYGSPGTGKSMAAHAIANQLGRKILTVDYSQIESKFVGETAKNLVSMFDYAKESGAVIFFDEADALLSRRVTNMSNSTDVSVNQTRSVLLMLVNEYDDLILFASNFITNYDPAFMRRISAHVKFDLPDEDSRLKLWRLYIPQKMPTDVDIPALAKKVLGYFRGRYIRICIECLAPCRKGECGRSFPWLF